MIAVTGPSVLRGQGSRSTCPSAPRASDGGCHLLYGDPDPSKVAAQPRVAGRILH